MKYWRTMLFAAALAACGFAVWAGDSLKGETPRSAPAPAAESKPAPPSEPARDVAAAPPILALPTPAVPDLTPAPPAVSLPVAPPVVPPPLDTPAPIRPAKADLPPALELLPPSKAPSPLKEHSAPPLKADIDTPSNAESFRKGIRYINGVQFGVPIQFDEPPEAKPATPPTAPPSPPTLPPIERRATVPAAQLQTTEPPTAPVASPYELHVRMGGKLGPRFEVRDGEALLLTVQCDRIELRSDRDGPGALPGLTAAGKVRVSGAGLHGTCDSLTVAAASGQVMMKGNVKLTCFRGDASTEVTAESMSFQLKGEAESRTSKEHEIKPKE